jgi:hypothetical protein
LNDPDIESETNALTNAEKEFESKSIGMIIKAVFTGILFLAVFIKLFFVILS